MLEVLKVKDRTVKADRLWETLKNVFDATIKHIGEYDKWKETDLGRLQMKMDVYEVNLKGNVEELKGLHYIMIDGFNRMVNPLGWSKEDVIGWLKKTGFKRDKRWYLEDYGMDEETWEEWNR